MVSEGIRTVECLPYQPPLAQRLLKKGDVRACIFRQCDRSTSWTGPVFFTDPARQPLANRKVRDVVRYTGLLVLVLLDGTEPRLNAKLHDLTGKTSA